MSKPRSGGMRGIFSNNWREETMEKIEKIVSSYLPSQMFSETFMKKFVDVIFNITRDVKWKTQVELFNLRSECKRLKLENELYQKECENLKSQNKNYRAKLGIFAVSCEDSPIKRRKISK